jgi:hypothetical protein
VSDRRTRIRATSDNVDGVGLGTHVLASMKPGKGIAVLVWNYHWRKNAAEEEFNVLIKNIPRSAVGGNKMHSAVYIIDSKNNNYYTDSSQTSLQVAREEDLEYSSTMNVPLKLEKHAVALILLTHK